MTDAIDPCPQRPPPAYAAPQATDDTRWSARTWSGAKVVHRVVADGIAPEQAVDEAIARIKQILSE